jgi:hypothetical protein
LHLLGGLHAVNRILHPKASAAKALAQMLPSNDKHPMLVTWLAGNSTVHQ